MVLDVHQRDEVARPANRSSQLAVSILEHPDLARLQRLWTDLESRSDASYFQSWAWIGCWLRALPVERRPPAMIVRSGDAVVALGLFGRQRNFRHGVLPTRGIYLNETGDAVLDSLTIEYNGLLAEHGRVVQAADACVAFLVDHDSDWDELFLSGMDPLQCEAFDTASRDRLAYRVLYEKPCPFVDLDSIRGNGGYLDSISRNSRYQIRRALRLYESAGAVAFQPARSLDEALHFLDGLKELHQSYWRERGQPGSFANPFFDRFHRRIIEERFHAGEIELAKISSPTMVIGYLYNFVHHDCVYAYQSGFRYEADAKRKPGLVSHYLAIDHHLRHGARIYDFMAGEGQHKKSLATHTRFLSWSRAQRSLLKFRVENSLRRWKNQGSFRRWIQPSADN